MATLSSTADMSERAMLDCAIDMMDEDDDYVPFMPIDPYKPKHRNKIQDFEPWFNACVARPVAKKEIERTPKAQAALDKEWNALRNAGVWDETKVFEWSAVANAARARGEKAHVGRIFELCVEKGSELPCLLYTSPSPRDS